MSDSKNKVTSVRVEIDAPASFVWDILVDLPRYREWNPYTVRVESSLKVGDEVHLYIANPADANNDIHVLEHLVAFEPSRLLAWEQRPTPENADAAYREQVLEVLDDGRCAYHTSDQFLGPNAEKIMNQFGDWVKGGFDGIARGLKAHAESLYKTSTASTASHR
ncbi:polyketide cyclase [Pandoraea captiosa]|uniref:Polyketide cyclase n=1 Tax=Pandoraea captiosa TaxID=2508302 RepID=A0A5E5ABT6_9BURK|nr:SRPBCC domain-containing protein [Pandoraea captiosa]VVE70005.1 polyketide cyclase [Pandoraea captiosa]